MDLHLETDRSLISDSGQSLRHLHCRLHALRAASDRERAPLDLALVLDRSGSMGGQKWPRACAAARRMVTRLDHRDRIALVVYDDRIDTLLPLSPVQGAIRDQVASALHGVGPRGMTNLGGGWLTGCGLVGGVMDNERLHRCFLLTDGQANEGITDPGELAEHARKLRRLGVITSTFGIGDDYNEALLGTLADAAGGAFHDIANADRIDAVLNGELGDALDVVHGDMRVWLRGPRGVRIDALGPWTQEFDGQSLCVRLGDLVSDQELDLLVAVRFPSGELGSTCPIELRVTDGQGLELATGIIHWTWADRDSRRAAPRRRAVDRLVASYYADAARRDASLDNQDGKLEQARHRLRTVARRIERYADEDAQLLALAASLVKEAERDHLERLNPRAAKMMYAEAIHRTKGRDGSGERRRGSSETG